MSTLTLGSGRSDDKDEDKENKSQCDGCLEWKYVKKIALIGGLKCRRHRVGEAISCITGKPLSANWKAKRLCDLCMSRFDSVNSIVGKISGIKVGDLYKLDTLSTPLVTPHTSPVRQAWRRPASTPTDKRRTPLRDIPPKQSLQSEAGSGKSKRSLFANVQSETPSGTFSNIELPGPVMPDENEPEQPLPSNHIDIPESAANKRVIDHPIVKESGLYFNSAYNLPAKLSLSDTAFLRKIVVTRDVGELIQGMFDSDFFKKLIRRLALHHIELEVTNAEQIGKLLKNVAPISTLVAAEDDLFFGILSEMAER